MRERIIVIILLFASTIYATGAFSGLSVAVKIERVGVQDDGIALVYAKDGWGSAANNGCSTGTGVLAFDSKSNAGKSILSVVLSAHATQKTVIASTHDNNCLPVGGMAASIRRIDVID